LSEPVKDSKCNVPACSYFSRQAWSQSPLVRAVGKEWPTYGASAKVCALDDLKRRIFVIVK